LSRANNLVSSNFYSSQMFLQLVGSWEKWEPYPIDVAESLGTIIGDDFVIVSGFSRSFGEVTKQVFAYNTKDPSAKWREMDEVPVPIGFSHAAFGVDGNIMYICGGYVGGTPGPHTDVCLKYTHNNPSKEQWSFLPPLPEGGRGGGGMVYMKITNSLLYATGATRPVNGPTIDRTDAWELRLDNLSAGWQSQPDIPYKGNHVSHVTAMFEGKQRHYFMGGQEEGDEYNSNFADNFEWDNTSKVWIKRADMLFPRGHASTSAFAYGCGFLIAGGAINDSKRTADISYYGIDTDSWTKVGDLTQTINTPACDIVRFDNGTDYIYCQTGPVSGSFSWRIQISLD
jgi:N-acetylneuraminic acid mutarotase